MSRAASAPTRDVVTRPAPRTTGPATRSTRPASAPRTRSTPRHQAPRAPRTRLNPLVKATVILFVAVVVSLMGSMAFSTRAVTLNTLQDQLLQEQSRYAEQVSFLSSSAAPGLVAAKASTLHLTHPVVVLQVPTVSLDAPLSLPKFLVPVSVVPRTVR